MFNDDDDKKEKGLFASKINPRLNTFLFIDDLAGGDITKHDAVYDMNYIYSLTIYLARMQRDQESTRDIPR